MYVSEEGASDVLIYAETGGAPVGTITAGVTDPYGLYIDKSGRLYVSNQESPCGPGGSVTVYRPGALYPSATYTEDLGRPLYAIVDGAGDLFVGNGNGASDGGSIVEFKPGSTHVFQILQTPGTEVDGMDFDLQGDLYASYRTGSGLGSIEEFAPGSTSGQVLGMSLNQPQGLVVDNGGTIVATQTGGTNDVVVFPPGATSPTIADALPSGSDPTQIALTAKERNLFVTSFPNAYVYKTWYPLHPEISWMLVDKVLQPDNQGIALSNGQVF